MRPSESYREINAVWAALSWWERSSSLACSGEASVGFEKSVNSTRRTRPAPAATLDRSAATAVACLEQRADFEKLAGL